jgi:phospholipase C
MNGAASSNTWRRRAQAANSVDPDIVNGKTLLGMRVPVVVASPWSAGNPANPTVNSLMFDHTSVLKMIEWRWGLRPLTPRDASTDVNNLAYALDFGNPQTAVPALPKPQTPFFVWPCFANLFGGFTSGGVPAQGTDLPAGAGSPSSSTRKTAVWEQVRETAKLHGFPVQ